RADRVGGRRLIVLEGGVLLLGRLRLDGRADRILERARIGERLAERRVRRRREHRGRQLAGHGLLLRGRVVGRVLLRQLLVLARQVEQRVLVLRRELRVGDQRGDREPGLVLRLVGRRERAPGVLVLRVLLDLLLQARDRCAAAAAEVERVLERRRDTG